MKFLPDLIRDNAIVEKRLAAKRRASIRRLKQRIANVTWDPLGKSLTRSINEAIDAWAARELP